jgi:anhydro-N-acetylmuramic acid kinase
MILRPKQRSMVVAGVMSGTSADGIDVALCRIVPPRRKQDSPKVSLIAGATFRYPNALRNVVLRVMEGGPMSAGDMSRLNWRLGQLYADAVQTTATKFRVRLDLVGCHGQTVHHEPNARRTYGAPVRSTWQLGEPAVLAERLRCPVISDLRPADLAAGGQGAPLVPMLDLCLFRSPRVSRVLQNVGGIGNLTALPTACATDQVLAFDTGPGNMVIDGCMTALFDKKYDRGGAVARRGLVLQEVVDRVLREKYFAATPPKSCGREEFGAAFCERFIAMCREAGGSDADCVATATGLTVASVLDGYKRFVMPHLEANAKGGVGPGRVEFCVAGGGVKNRTLMAMFREGFRELGVRVRPLSELGVPAQAKEAMAFALLVWLSWHWLPGNIPSATGASRPVILGKVSHG